MDTTKKILTIQVHCDGMMKEGRGGYHQEDTNYPGALRWDGEGRNEGGDTTKKILTIQVHCDGMVKEGMKGVIPPRRY